MKSRRRVNSAVGSLRHNKMDLRSLVTFALSLILPILFLVFVRCERIHSICELEVPLRIFIFPYAVLSILPFPETEVPFNILAVAQFPVYSALWYVARKRTRLRRPGLWLVGFHLVVGFAVFVIVANVLGQ